MDNNVRAYSFAFLSSITVGIAFVATKLVLQELNQLSTIVYSLAFSFIGSVIIVSFIVKRSWITQAREHWKHMALLAAISTTAPIVLTYSIDTIGPSLTSFLTRFTVFFTVLIGFFFFKERFNKIEAIGMAIAVFGAFMITYTTEGAALISSVMVILVCVLFAVMQLIVKTHTSKMDYYVINHIRIVSNFFILLVIAFSTASLQMPSINSLVLCAIIGIGNGIIGFALFFKALKMADMSKVNIIRVSDPFLTVFFSFILLSTIPTMQQLLGGVVIAIGIFILIVARHKPKLIARWFT
jgi:drug/metabolite transporter (DMT)-like permease